MKTTVISNPPDTACECGSWLKHWERVTNWKPYLCAERYCKAYAAVGVHVKKCDANDTETYIIPLCNEHANMKGREIEVIEHIKLASADTNRTCGKAFNTPDSDSDGDSGSDMKIAIP
jgi:predicted metal-dependent TIM-barrel fold hydrolase